MSETETTLIQKLRATAFDKDNCPRMDSERWCPVGLAKQAADALTASLSREAALREALKECRDQLWLLAKTPRDNPWIKQADAALALKSPAA